MGCKQDKTWDFVIYSGTIEFVKQDRDENMLPSYISISGVTLSLEED